VKPRGLILSVHKPLGWTSFDVVNKLRRALRWKSVGHAGTLDPAAEGVLLLLFGSATGRAQEFMDLPKEYRARIRFGITTESDDLEGRDIPANPLSDWCESRVRSALNEFVGEIEQVPPAVSAIKVAGKRSYELARAGKPAVLQPRMVQVHGAEVIAVSNPDVDVVITCSRGTYIRSIARDLGQSLGWGGVLAALTRSAVGPYRIENALTMSDILKRSLEFRFE
jgi:tRNA pseudouridine55 synthase